MKKWTLHGGVSKHSKGSVCTFMKVITCYFSGIIHLIHGVFLVLVTGISGHNCGYPEKSIWGCFTFEIVSYQAWIAATARNKVTFFFTSGRCRSSQENGGRNQPQKFMALNPRYKADMWVESSGYDCYIAIENGHRNSGFSQKIVKIVIFHSYVKLPEGKSTKLIQIVSRFCHKSSFL